MKKILLSFIVFAILSCGGNNTGETASGSNAGDGSETGLDGAKLIASSDCSACHNEKENLIGPGYLQVAERYPENDSTINFLATKIIEGGAGNWGHTPMPPHPQHSREEATEMARYILSLKN